MKGHIRERSPGRWAIVLDVQDPVTGKRKGRRWHKFLGTRRQAQSECARLVAELQSGASFDPNKLTVAAYLEQWLEHMRPLVSPRTHERYGELARKNLVPRLGGLPLARLQAIQISTAYAQALARGRVDGTGGLSARTVLHMHRLTKMALRKAVRWRLLGRNPADDVDPPKVERIPMNTYDLPETAALLAAARGTRMLVPTILAVLCGLRRGEIIGLRWRSVALDRSELAVVESAEQTAAGVRIKETKTGRDRTVALSAFVVVELRGHRARQAEELLRVGIRLSPDTLVVAQADGRLIQPRSLTHEWAKLVARRGLRRIRFHDLRHAHATHMLASGVHPKIASERLGHSSVGITLDLYSHATRGMQADAAALVDAALQAAITGRAEDIG
jgi:integrase